MTILGYLILGPGVPWERQYQKKSTLNPISADYLTRRWARGPANLSKARILSYMELAIDAVARVLDDYVSKARVASCMDIETDTMARVLELVSALARVLDGFESSIEVIYRVAE